VQVPVEGHGINSATTGLEYTPSLTQCRLGFLEMLENGSTENAVDRAVGYGHSVGCSHEVDFVETVSRAWMVESDPSGDVLVREELLSLSSAADVENSTLNVVAECPLDDVASPAHHHPGGICEAVNAQIVS
jgi:hypothetical protein